MRKKKNFWLTILCLLLMLSSFNVNAQTGRCGLKEGINNQPLRDPGQNPSLLAQVRRLAARSGSAPVVTIPVVVHVLFHNAQENISDAQILSQIDALNRDYRKLNADAGSVPDEFKPVAADCQVEFCLAQRDPQGKATTGITRRKTYHSSWDVNVIYPEDSTDYYTKAFHTASGGENAWDPTKYLNIYVGNLDDVLGVASLPSYPASPAVGSADDVCFVHFASFGTMGPDLLSAWTEGGIATHEVGHYLDLFHIFQGGCSNQDGVSDTPPQAYAHTGSFNLQTDVLNTCTFDAVNDMYMNFMDYSNDNSINMFTEGQKERMLALFVAGGARSSLLSSQGCSPGQPNPNACDPLPTNLVLGNLSPNSATITWTGAAAATNYYGALLQVGGTVGNDTYIPSQPTSVTLSNLQPATTYRYYLYGSCPNNSSASAYIDFTTPPCPQAPQLAVVPGPTFASFSWPLVAGYNSNYLLEMQNGAVWSTVYNGPNGQSTTNNLQPNTFYTFRLSANCNPANPSYTTVSFTTPVCTAPTGLTVGQLTPTYAALSWDAKPYGPLTYHIQRTPAGTAFGNADAGTTTANAFQLPVPAQSTAYDARIFLSCNGKNYYSNVVSFTSHYSCAADAYEPNETMGTAYVLPPAGFNTSSPSVRTYALNGLICTNDPQLGAGAGDNDWFRFSNASSRGFVNPLAGFPDVSINLKALGTDYVARLFNAAGVEIGTSSYSLASGQTIVYHPCNGATGTYYVQVNSQGGSYSNNSYTLNIKLTAASYPCYALRSSEGASVTPNPGKGLFRAYFPSGTIQLTLISPGGNLVRRYPVGGQRTSMPLDLSMLPSGVYLLRVEGPLGTSSSHRLVKQ